LNLMSKPSAHKNRKRIRRKKSRLTTQPQAEFVWGIHSILEGLKTCPQAIREIIVDKEHAGQRVNQVLEIAREKAIPVREVTDSLRTDAEKHGKLSEHERSQPIAARIRLPIMTLDELLDRLKSVAETPLILALDSIQDPHNLGAIIRSAVAAGVNGIILPKDRSAAVTATVIRVSAGAAYHLDICMVTNLVSSFKVLKEYGIWIFGTTKDAAQTIYDADLTVPTCLVIGGEEKGLRPLVAEQCDQHITIPMQSSLDSLNASVAAGIILFETVRQRRRLNE
jgi:23S rRNA (guanosine2251-2'-O)-methyltransferase